MFSLPRCSSCSAEIAAETPVRLSREKNDVTDITAPQPSHQSAHVAMTTSACGEEACTEPAGQQGKAATECVRNAAVSCTPLYIITSERGQRQQLSYIYRNVIRVHGRLRLQGNLHGRGDCRHAAERTAAAKSNTQRGLDPGFMVVTALRFFCTVCQVVC